VTTQKKNMIRSLVIEERCLKCRRYIVSNEELIINRKYKRMWNKVTVAYFKALTSICVDRIKLNAKSQLGTRQVAQVLKPTSQEIYFVTDPATLTYTHKKIM
jgi:hypothetical protein